MSKEAKVTELDPVEGLTTKRDVLAAIEQLKLQPEDLFTGEQLAKSKSVAATVNLATGLVLAECIKASPIMSGKSKGVASYMGNVLLGKVDLTGKTMAEAQAIVDRAIDAEMTNMARLGYTIEGDGGGKSTGSATNPLLNPPAGSDFQARMRANPLLQP